MIATIVIWLLQSFDIRFQMVADSKDSILAMIAGLLEPVMRPLGLGDWRICTSLISGVIAKESVVSTMNILFGNLVASALSAASAASLLVFSLLYTPCVAAVSAIKREMGRSWAAGVVIYQCVVAWLCALAVYGIANLL